MIAHLLLALPVLADQDAPAQLQFGSKVATVKVGKWLHGAPISKLVKGKVYVIEFWDFPWDGPNAAMAKRIASVSNSKPGQTIFLAILSSGPFPSPGKRGTARMEPNPLGFHVAKENRDQYMYRHWMQPAGRPGLPGPSTFIVGKTGFIEWFGLMDQDFEQVYAEVLRGNYSRAKRAARFEKKVHDVEAVDDARESFQQAMKEMRWKDAVKAADKVIVLVPKEEGPIAGYRFYALAKYDESAAMNYARAVAPKINDNFSALNNLAYSLVDPDSKFKNPDYALGLKLAERAYELSGERKDYILDTLAMAAFKTGDAPRAIAIQKKLIEFYKGLGLGEDSAPIQECKDKIALFAGKSNQPPQ